MTIGTLKLSSTTEYLDWDAARHEDRLIHIRITGEEGLVSIERCYGLISLADEEVGKEKVDHCETKRIPIRPADVPRPYTESEIAAVITLPTTPKQLLQNLKNAWDHDWLVQSPFYADSNLLKFFNATKVAWEQESKRGDAADFGHGWLSIDSQFFPKMSVEFMRGVREELRHQNARPAAVSGFVRIRVPSVSGFTVGLVRDIFGKESEEQLDFGIATDAHGYDPASAGSLLYENHDKERRTAPYEKYRVSFGVKKSKPGLPIQGSSFLPSEEVEEIVMFQAER
jgi:hypothetical protein